MSATTHAVTAEEFAAAVRAALSDLPPEELDELTGGLEADLLERAAESGEAAWGDPVEYAEELRSAAGLPRFAPPGTRSPLADRILREWRDVVEGARTLATDFPLPAAVGSFFVALRPVWWVFRGWALFLLVALFANSLGVGVALSYLPVTPISILMLLACVVVSVQFGRGAWAPRGSRVLLGVANVVLVIAAPFIVGWAMAEINRGAYADEALAYEYVPEGITVNGKPVSNVFAYDREGDLLEDVQLYDQDGDPIVVRDDPQGTGFLPAPDGTFLVPNSEVLGRPAWNVFPLDAVGDDDLQSDGSADLDAAEAVDAPFEAVAPLRDAVDEAVEDSRDEAPPTAR